MREIGLEKSTYIEKPYPHCLGKRSKLGGVPDWIQNKEHVKCPSCKVEMKFVCQIDSLDYTGQVPSNDDPNEYMFGDAGMIYVFFCFDCCETKSLHQSY